MTVVPIGEGLVRQLRIVCSAPALAPFVEAVYWDADKRAAIVEPLLGNTARVRDKLDELGFRIRSSVIGIQVVP